MASMEINGKLDLSPGDREALARVMRDTHQESDLRPDGVANGAYSSVPGDAWFIDGIKGALTPVFEKMRDNLAAAYLFGSTSIGEAGPRSDIDLAVLLTCEDLGADFDIRLDLYADCCRALKRNDVDIVVLNRTKNLFLLNDVMRNGILLFDGDTGVREEFEVMVIHDFIEFREHRLRVMGV